jgi:hypothetical protein
LVTEQTTVVGHTVVNDGGSLPDASLHTSPFANSASSSALLSLAMTTTQANSSTPGLLDSGVVPIAMSSTLSLATITDVVPGICASSSVGHTSALVGEVGFIAAPSGVAVGFIAAPPANDSTTTNSREVGSVAAPTGLAVGFIAARPDDITSTPIREVGFIAAPTRVADGFIAAPLNDCTTMVGEAGFIAAPSGLADGFSAARPDDNASVNTREVGLIAAPSGNSLVMATGSLSFLGHIIQLNSKGSISGQSRLIDADGFVTPLGSRRSPSPFRCTSTPPVASPKFFSSQWLPEEVPTNNEQDNLSENIVFPKATTPVSTTGSPLLVPMLSILDNSSGATISSSGSPRLSVSSVMSNFRSSPEMVASQDITDEQYAAFMTSVFDGILDPELRDRITARANAVAKERGRSPVTSAPPSSPASPIPSPIHLVAMGLPSTSTPAVPPPYPSVPPLQPQSSQLQQQASQSRIHFRPSVEVIEDEGDYVSVMAAQIEADRALALSLEEQTPRSSTLVDESEEELPPLIPIDFTADYDNNALAQALAARFNLPDGVADAVISQMVSGSKQSSSTRPTVPSPQTPPSVLPGGFKTVISFLSAQIPASSYLARAWHSPGNPSIITTPATPTRVSATTQVSSRISSWTESTGISICELPD